MDAQSTIIITLPSVVRDKIPLPPRTAHLDLSRISIPKKENVKQGQGVQEQTRKRKLENLSHEEKLLRKKMKNRVAAQNSRDKKRAQMEELEMLLQEVKQQVQLENAALKEENAELKKHNKCSCRTSEACMDSVTNRGTHETGPAVSVSQGLGTTGGDGLASIVLRLGLVASDFVSTPSNSEQENSRIKLDSSSEPLVAPESTDCTQMVGTSPEHLESHEDIQLMDREEEVWCEESQCASVSPLSVDSAYPSSPAMSIQDIQSLECPSSPTVSIQDVLSVECPSSPGEDILSPEDEEELLRIVSEFPTSPMSSLSSSDPGYESLDSPAVSIDQFDLLSISELFPDLI
ncbi:hypothetical protein B566_EDAN003508 [Ephemera danica]|nr:hypothetical protein B566_EDAN003508 [Ephemera danica]